MTRARFRGAIALLIGLILLGCSQPAPPVEPAKPTAPPAPAAAPAAPAPSPAVPPSASPSPLASPSPAAGSAQPAPSPAAASGSTAAAPPLLPVPAVSAQARQDAESFFRGKSVRLIVGLSAGGGYDIMARLVARHLTKHIPGNPAVVVENMTGAAGAVAANTVFNSAAKDGSVISLFSETLLQTQFLAAQGVQFDARKFTWLGSTQNQTAICAARVDSGILSYQDIQSGGKKLIVGSTSPGSNTNDFPSILKGALGANIQVVPGYPGTNEIRLAMEKNETNGACITWESLKVTSSEWFSGPNRFATLLVQQGAEKHPDLPNVPLAEEFAQSPSQKAIVRAITASLPISKPFVIPPGVPADRVAVMQAAFAETMNDPDLRQEAAQAKIDIYPRTPEAVQRIVDEVLSAPPEVVTEIKKILGT